MIIDFVFYTGFALLLTHELDAIKRHEWRIFPGLSNLTDDLAYRIFVILHVPLFILLLWLLCHPSEYVRYWFPVGIDIFLMIHLGLHLFFTSHDQNEFSNAFSKAIIYLGAIMGLAHICLLVSR